MSKDQGWKADWSQEFLLAEFSALRQEIVKRTEIQHQLLSLALAAAGAFLTVKAEIAILAYPILALFLAAAWVQNDCQIARLGTYIRKRIELRMLDSRGGWESVWASTPDDIESLGSLAHFSSRGVFVGSQAAMLLLSLLTYQLGADGPRLITLLTGDFSRRNPELYGVLFLVSADIVAIILTLYLLRRHKVVLDTREEWFDATTQWAEKKASAD